MTPGVALRIIAILLVGATCNIYIAAAPSIVGALVDHQGFTNSFAGRLFAFNTWGATAASAISIAVIHAGGWDLRKAILGCLLLVILTSSGAAWLANWPLLLATNWFLNGMAAGMSFSVCAVALIGTPHVERSYAVLFGSPFVIGAVGLASFPSVYRLLGIEGVFYGVALLNLLVIALVPVFPRSVEPPQVGHHVSAAKPIDRRGIGLLSLLLLALYFYNTSNTGIWVYFERIGVSYGLSADASGAILAPSLAAGIVGMVLAGVLGDRWGFVLPIYIGTILISASTLALAVSSSVTVFGIATAVFNACITFVVPYFLSLAAFLLPSGRGVAAANFLLQAGFATGAFIASILVRGNDFTVLFGATLSGFLIVLVLTTLFSGAARHCKRLPMPGN